MADKLMRKFLAVAALGLAFIAPAKAATYDTPSVLPPITLGNILVGSQSGLPQDVSVYGLPANAPTGLLLASPALANNQGYGILINGTLSTSFGFNSGGISIADLINPGGSQTSTQGVNVNQSLGAAAGNITNHVGVLVTDTIDATYVGTAPTIIQFEAASPVNNSANLSPLIEFYATGGANGNGNASGALVNTEFRANAWTAAGATGGTVNNEGMLIFLSTGSGSGTTNNYGLYITGNGGSGGAGATNNYAIYAPSTAVWYGNPNSVGWTSSVATVLQQNYQLITGGTVAALGGTTAGLVSMANTIDVSGAASVVSEYGGTFAPTMGANGTANVANYYGVNSTMTIAAAYAGTAPVVHGFYFANLVNSSANPVLTFVEFDGASLANNNNATAGTTNNSTFRANGWTAASGAGGTINNYDFNAVTPTAGGAGTTNNYGLYVQGNGATACTGTCTNYAGYFTLSAGNNTAISNYGIYINGNGGASAANNYALFSASTAPMKISGLFLNAVYAIASLPSCSATLQGATAIVNNGQASPTYLGTVSTTGTVIARVMCNGTAWVYAANDNVPWRKVA